MRSTPNARERPEELCNRSVPRDPAISHPHQFTEHAIQEFGNHPMKMTGTGPSELVSNRNMTWLSATRTNLRTMQT